MLHLKFICRVVCRCAHLELRKEIGLETEHLTNIHEVLVISQHCSLSLWSCVCVCETHTHEHMLVGRLAWATQYKITMDYDECCDL